MKRVSILDHMKIVKKRKTGSKKDIIGEFEVLSD